jgi:hypothetical protein
MKVRKAYKERLKVKQDQKNPQRFLRFKKKGQGIDSFRYRQGFKRRDMARPASATSEAPGKKVRARSRLNSSLLGRGWFEFHRQLEDKLAWNGGWLISVAPSCRRQQESTKATAQKRMPMRRCWWNPRSSGRRECQIAGRPGSIDRGVQVARSGGRVVVQREDGPWLLDGLIPIQELKDRLDLRSVPEEQRRPGSAPDSEM